MTPATPTDPPSFTPPITGGILGSIRLRRPGPIEFLLMLAFAFLLTANLGRWSLNADEARYAHTVSYSWSGMYHWLRSDNYPPGYFVLFKLWTELAGMGERALRLFSLPFGFLGLLLFGYWAFKAFGWRIGRRTWLFLAFSPFLLILDRMAKYYALFIFLTVASTSLLWWILERREKWEARAAGNATPPDTAALKTTWKLEALWAAASLALLWVHYLGAVVWLAMGGWLLWRWGRHGSRPARRLFLLLCAAFIGFLPWMPVLIARLAATGANPSAATGAAGAAAAGVGAAGVGALRLTVAKLGYTAYAFALGHTLEVSHLALAAMGCGVAWTEFVWGVGRTVRGTQDANRPAPESGSIPTPGSDVESAPPVTEHEEKDSVPPDQPDTSELTQNSAPAEKDGRPIEAARYCLYLVIVMGVASYAILAVFLSGLPVLAVSERLGFLLPYVVALACFGVDRWNRWVRWATAVIYLVPVWVSLCSLEGMPVLPPVLFKPHYVFENNLWDQKIPWNRVVQEVAESPERPTDVLFDNYSFGSLGWYYLRPVADRFTDVFSKEGGPRKSIESLVEGTKGAGRIFLVRSTRDLSPDEKVTKLEKALTKRYGFYCASVRLAFDSPGMRKLKKWFRRGSEVETYPAKVTIREFCPGGS